MARYKFTVANTNLTLQINANNVLNQAYYQTPGYLIGIQPGTPRTLLGSLKVAF
jgi:outer membrane receptor protein involved in Fe transport